MEIDRRALALCLGAVLLVAACSSSNSNKSNASTAGGGGGHSGGGGGPAPLPDKVVGKACKASSDCATGVCSTMLGANGLTGTMGTPAPDGYCTSSCAADTDCGSTGACVGAFAGIPGLPIGGAGAGMSGQCYLVCMVDTDCRDGYRCVDGLGLPVTATAGSGGSDGASAGVGVPVFAGLGGASTCQPAPVTDKLTGSTVGSMCSADGDCAGGRCATTNGLGTNYPGGYCTGRCLQDSDCGDAGSCTQGFPGMAGTCYRNCTSDADCGRDGYRCRAAVAVGLPGATGGSSLMQCMPGDKPLAAGVVGSACGADADCGGIAMSCELSTRTPGGYCSQRCADSSDCGAGGTCIGAFGGAIASGTCYKTCTATTDCRTGYACGMVGAVGFPGAMNTSPMVCTLAPPTEDAGTP